MSGRKSKLKGSRLELDMAHSFKEWWGRGEWCRTPGSGGWATSGNRDGFRARGDIMTTDIEFPFTVECKNQESWDLNQMLTAPACKPYQWWEQSVAQAEIATIPLLIMKRNRAAPLVMLNSFPSLSSYLSDNNVKRFYLYGDEILVIFKLEDLFKIPRERILAMANEQIPKCDKCKQVTLRCKCIEKSLNK